MQIRSAKELIVYRKAYELAMEVFKITRRFPVGERYSLTDQVRRSSLSVCTNLREAWAKRRYGAHFVNNLTDAGGENSETDTWLDFAHDCDYLSPVDHDHLGGLSAEVGAMLGAMIKNPTPFLLNPR